MDATLHLLSTRPEIAGGARVSTEDIACWAGHLDKDVTEFLDRLGGEIAKSYECGDLSYEFCDLLVNDLFGLLVQRQFLDPQGSWPHLFYEVYEAFDAGEFHRKADYSDDPVAEFTNPAVANIVAKL